MLELKKGKYMFGTVKVGERGQVVLPKDARKKFGIRAGDSLLVLGDDTKGLSIMKADLIKKFALSILEGGD